jgi:hypothetical protein
VNEKEYKKAECSKSEVFHLHRSRRDADYAAVDVGLADYFEKLGHSEIAAKLRKRADIGNGSSSLEAERADHYRQMGALVDTMESDQPIARAAGGEDINKLAPTDVRVVIPTAPTPAERIYGSDGLTMVARTGQPPAPQYAPVPLEFEHLIKVGDDE